MNQDDTVRTPDAGHEAQPSPGLSDSSNQTGKGKHVLDWMLGAIALVSISLNIVQFSWKADDRNRSQPGPLTYRILMPATDGGLFARVSEHKDVVFEQFPNPRVLRTATFQKAKAALATLSNLELRSMTWSFLVIRNISDEAYTNVSLTQPSGEQEIGLLEPNSTCFVFYESANALVSSSLRYQVHGTTKQRSLPVSAPPDSKSTIPLLTVLAGITRLGSLEGFDKSDRLYQFKRSDQYEIPSEGP